MDHTEIGLRAAVRALSDVVAPVVGAEHAQAQDQLRLSIDYIGFVVERLPHLHQRDRFELSHHLTMALAVREAIGSAVVPPPLSTAIGVGEQVLALADATTAELRQASATLAAVLAAVVRDSTTQAGHVQREIERCVLRMSKERIAFERAWHLPLRLDPDPHDVQPLSDFLPMTR
jgi:hypothetical protein